MQCRRLCFIRLWIYKTTVMNPWDNILTKSEIDRLRKHDCEYPWTPQDMLRLIRKIESLQGDVLKIPESGSPWIQTYTGKKLSLLDPQPEEFDLESIAIGVSREFRFGNQSCVPYTVGQHSYHVSTICKEFPLEGLFHDGVEAFTRDLPSPLKKVLPQYEIIEKRLWRALAEKFGLQKELPAEVIKADKIMVATECLQLMLKPKEMYSIEEDPININLIPPWPMDLTEGMFKKRYYELTV